MNKHYSKFKSNRNKYRVLRQSASNGMTLKSRGHFRSEPCLKLSMDVYKFLNNLGLTTFYIRRLK